MDVSGSSPFNQVRAVPSNIMVKYLAIAASVTSSLYSHLVAFNPCPWL